MILGGLGNILYSTRIIRWKSPIVRDGECVVESQLTTGGTAYYPLVVPAPKGTAVTGLRRKAGRARSTKRGPGEEMLALKVVKLGLKHFHDDVIIHVDGHNYVPDLAFIDVERAIFIDIENDESPTHTASSCPPTARAGRTSGATRSSQALAGQ